jgi:hypothetical protein
MTSEYSAVNCGDSLTLLQTSLIHNEKRTADFSKDYIKTMQDLQSTITESMSVL